MHNFVEGEPLTRFPENFGGIEGFFIVLYCNLIFITIQIHTFLQPVYDFILCRIIGLQGV